MIYFLSPLTPVGLEQTTEIALVYTKRKLSIVSNNRNCVGVHEEEAFNRFKQPKWRWCTRRGSFQSFQTTEIALVYAKRKLSIVSNNRNCVGVHGEEAFNRFKQPKLRWCTRRGSFQSFQTTEIALVYTKRKL